VYIVSSYVHIGSALSCKDFDQATMSITERECGDGSMPPAVGSAFGSHGVQIRETFGASDTDGESLTDDDLPPIRDFLQHKRNPKVIDFTGATMTWWVFSKK
jgi:hypothetical protein